MIIKHLSLILALFFLGCGSVDSKSAPKPIPTELLVPLYSYPTDKQNAIGNIWDAVAEASSRTPLTVIFGVIREDGAPVGTPNSDYILGLKKLREANASILAYVETTNGSRDIEEIKTDVIAYANHFDIDGIFFDEVNGDTQFTDYYNEITNYAKSFDSVKKVMLNSPGVQKDFIQQSTADDFLVFENYYRYWNEFDSTEYDGLDYEKLHIIVHTVPDADAMKTVIQEANQKNITNLYITNREFSHLPTFWDDEISFIQERNALLK